MKNARIVAVASLALAAAPFAHAHAFPKHQTPDAGATVAASPHEVSIEFDDGLEPAFSSIAVTDAQGKAMTRDKPQFDPKDKKRMSVAVQDLPPGKYTVTWVAVADDGHRTQGHYGFNVKP